MTNTKNLMRNLIGLSMIGVVRGRRTECRNRSNSAAILTRSLCLGLAFCLPAAPVLVVRMWTRHGGEGGQRTRHASELGKDEGISPVAHQKRAVLSRGQPPPCLPSVP